MKIIFLDIDGVLNTYGATTNTVAGYTFVDDDKVELLQQLVSRTGAKVVLSSTWREGWEALDTYSENEIPDKYKTDVILFKALKQKLLDFGIELFDYTGIFGERGLEIDAWLKKAHEEPMEGFVILDDMSGAHLRPHSQYLVQTSMCDGLTQKHIDRAAKLLGELK